MKIYREVTIDMNPESSSYGEHLSEDSYDYNGPLALAYYSRGDWITAMIWQDEDGNEYSLEFKRQGGQTDPNNLSGEGSMPIVKHATIRKKAVGSDTWNVARQWGSENLQGGKRPIEAVERYIRNTATPTVIGHISDWGLAPNLFGATSRSTAGMSLKEFAMDLGGEEWAYGSAQADNPGANTSMESLAEYNEQLNLAIGDIGVREKLETLEDIPEFKFDEAMDWVDQLGETVNYANIDRKSILDKLRNDEEFSKEEKNILGFAKHLQEENLGSTLEQALVYLENQEGGFEAVIGSLKEDAEEYHTDIAEEKLDVESDIQAQRDLVYGVGAQYDDEGNVIIDEETGNILDAEGNIVEGGSYQGTQADIVSAEASKEAALAGVVTAQAGVVTAEGQLELALLDIENYPEQVRNQLEALYQKRNLAVSGITSEYGLNVQSRLADIYGGAGETIVGAKLRDAQKQKEHYLKQLGFQASGLIEGIEGVKDKEIMAIGEEGVQFDEEGNVIGAGGRLGNIATTAAGTLAGARGSVTSAEAAVDAAIGNIEGYKTKLGQYSQTMDIFEKGEWDEYDIFKEQEFGEFEGSLATYAQNFGEKLLDVDNTGAYLYDFD